MQAHGYDPGEGEKKVLEGISAEAMPLGRGEWMELETGDRGQFHLHSRQQKTGDQHNGQQMWVRGLTYQESLLIRKSKSPDLKRFPNEISC